MVSWLLGLLVCVSLTGSSPPGVARAGSQPRKIPAGEYGPSKKGQRPRRGNLKRGKGAHKAKQRRKRTRAIRDLQLPEDMEKLTAAVSQRRFRQALGLANQKLVDSPLNGHLHAAVAVSCGHYGDYPCVVSSHQEAQSTGSLIVMRDAAKADALRFLGHPAEAAELRRTLVVHNSRENRELSLLTGLVLDLEAAGDLEGAHEAAWDAVALDPDSPIGWTLVARVEGLTGTLEEAESYLWLADRTGVSSVTRTATRAELHRTHGDPHYAASLFTGPAVSTKQSSLYAVARTRALLAADLPHEVLDIYQTCAWCLGEEVWHPDLMATFGEALARVGRTGEALAYADRLERTYPHHPPARTAVTAIRAARP